MSLLKTKLKDVEKSVDTKDNKIKELEKELSTKNSTTASSNTSLQIENNKLKKEVEELKSKSTSTPASGTAASKEIRDLKAAIAKHELSEEQLVIAKAKLTTENEELEGKELCKSED